MTYIRSYSPYDNVKVCSPRMSKPRAMSPALLVRCAGVRSSLLRHAHASLVRINPSECEWLTRGACVDQLQRYPPIYATASYNDTRVGYWEPAKWVARLRASASPDSGVLLLHTEFEGGHFGSGGRAGYLADIAREYAFLYLALGLDAADAKRPRQGAWW